ncbi:hypothetical protein M3890_004666 [Vibrio parahaemolyticus]|nr:hypothetical protein [Vibrio parahaemolyticus]HBC3550359.1 hypothetical protein [Vibrio parahaemolyticus]
MEIFDVLLQWLNVNWRAVIATISLILSGYFAYQKIGNKIGLKYQVNIGGYSDEQINNLVISNRKDKTISIWSIDAVLENDIKFEVYKPEVPLILKSGESISVSPEQYSYLHLDGDKFVPKFLFGKIDFYVNLGNKRVKCIDEKISDKRNSSYRVATKSRVSLDGHLYNENVRFVLIYYFEDQKQFAFFETNGFIGHEWGKTPNHMGSENYDANSIKTMLEHYGYDAMFSNYVCLENCGPKDGFKVAFRKTNT